MRRLVALMMLAMPGLAWPGGAVRAGESYAIDQRFGDIAFKVSNLGLFSSQGTFRRFTGQLTIDEAHPENTRIAVVIDTDSLSMAWTEAASMLRSPDYFDVQKYPVARFTSNRVVAESEVRYEIDGLLEIRGVTQPVVLHAALVGRHATADAGVEIADFVVTGELRRSMFGMTADQTFVSDRVALHIDARVRLTAPAHAG